MNHPAYKYDDINRDFPTPDDEREEERQQTWEAWLFLAVVLMGVLSTAVGVITVATYWVIR